MYPLPILLMMQICYRYTWLVASFPGLPRFFCSSVSIDNNTRIRVSLSTETEDQKKRGRPGNEATWLASFVLLGGLTDEREDHVSEKNSDSSFFVGSTELPKPP